MPTTDSHLYLELTIRFNYFTWTRIRANNSTMDVRRVVYMHITKIESHSPAQYPGKLAHVRVWGPHCYNIEKLNIECCNISNITLSR